MKDKENIKQINNLAISYIMLKGLRGQTLEKENPFLIYLMYSMFKSNELKDSEHEETNPNIYLIDFQKGIEDNINYIPNTLFHYLIEESYNMYGNLNSMKNLVDSVINEQVLSQLENKDNFINELVDNYKSSLIYILLNYNSKKENYNKIKIEILKDELNRVVEIEDYDSAIIYRDKIKETEIRLLEVNNEIKEE